MNMKLSFKILTAAFAILMLGCGASKVSSGKRTSNSTTGTNTQGTPALTECNVIPANSIGIAGVMSSYFNPTTRGYDDSINKLYLKQVPSTITSTTTQYLQVIRWQINTSTGAPAYQSSGANLIFMLKNNAQVINSNAPVQVLSKASITNTINTYGLSSAGITVDNFLSKVIVLVTGLTAQDDAIAISLYDTAQGTSSISKVSALLTPFAANPAVYQATHPWFDLYSLHPNLNLGAGLSDSYYVEALNQYCLQFL
jgi:hypothetical protein